MISFIIPSYNNLQHLRNAYESIKKNAPIAEVVLLDDGSTDGTWEWIWEQAESHQHREVKCYKSDERVGHTILYDKGIELATNEIVGIIHADMIIAPNYVENILKHLKPGKVVCGTRVEPPLHPPGKEKITKDFGLDFDTLNISAFESFARQESQRNKDRVSKGMFAPWVIYKKDFQAIGGHDPIFAPFPYEDSDIFQRWILAGYELLQSRDALVYHLTCRGHRWTEQVGKDDEYYKQVSERAARNYLRKWGSWIKNDEYQHPIVPPVYDIAFRIKNCTTQTLTAFEPWCSKIAVDLDTESVNNYILNEQSKTTFNLKDKIVLYDAELGNDIVAEFDVTKFTDYSNNIFSNLRNIIEQSGEEGVFELDIFNIYIKKMIDRKSDLVKCNK